MSLRVAAYTSGTNVPSARFRVRQLIPELLRYNVRVKEYPSPVDKYGQTYPPGLYYKIAARTGSSPQDLWLKRKRLKRWPAVVASRFADVTWLERILVPEKLTQELKLRKPLVFDIDDAIWLPGSEGFGFLDKVVRHADMVFAGNEYLADWCSAYCSNVQVVHTSVDTNRFFPSAGKSNEKRIIGWIGTSSNFAYLQSIVPVIEKILCDFPDTEFHVCAEKNPPFQLPRQFFTPWSAETEVAFLQSLDIGLMPLPDDEWTRGKCSFKMLQYMASGVPAVASRVGMNIQVLRDWDDRFGASSGEEWEHVLRMLLSNDELRATAGAGARKIIEEKYASAVIAAQVAAHFKSLR